MSHLKFTLLSVMLTDKYSEYTIQFKNNPSSSTNSRRARLEQREANSILIKAIARKIDPINVFDDTRYP